jgi:hypothetical protein
MDHFKRTGIVINLVPVTDKPSGVLVSEKDKVLKALFDEVTNVREGILIDLGNTTLKKVLFGVSEILVAIIIGVISLVQIILYSGTITPSLISGIVYFSIATLAVSTYSGVVGLFAQYQQYDLNIIKCVQAVNMYDRLLNSIEKISLTDSDKRDPAKIKRVKDRFADAKMNLDKRV